ncbi:MULTISPECIES: flagellar basal body-associated protein FliL [Thioalkalivibrio]|uniref:Flagellar protein FliL n=1 Tax=Thioalkalivibrio versutus TaxID=106634 RepID=A0A0G3G175_9GAMM|nr:MULTISPECIES: flagellar basal body-associated FliL family protein [Thioalkalivibrio]AKJ94988.1 flagellar basal body-associated protein FliL [Thioalkalivibrio versutus]
MADKEVNLDDDEGGAPKKGGMGKLILLLLIVILLVGGGAAAAWFFLVAGDDDAEQVEEGPPERFYTSLEPMTVNIEAPGRIRYLRAEVSLVTHEAPVIEAFERHMPAIRNDILGILAEQRYEDLNTRDGKESLAEELKEAIREILRSRDAPDAVEAVLFNELVMQ